MQTLLSSNPVIYTSTLIGWKNSHYSFIFKSVTSAKLKCAWHHLTIFLKLPWIYYHNHRDITCQPPPSYSFYYTPSVSRTMKGTNHTFTSFFFLQISPNAQSFTQHTLSNFSTSCLIINNLILLFYTSTLNLPGTNSSPPYHPQTKTFKISFPFLSLTHSSQEIAWFH